MATYLEVWTSSGPELVALDAERCTVGSDEANNVALTGDKTVSRMHAILQEYAAGWCIRDVGSRNGTWVNGERIWIERRLRPGDEIRVGRTRIVYRDGATSGITVTEAAQGPPDLTRREKDVLVALCQPLLSVDVFTEPASNKDIASALYVTEAAVRQHLMNLYDKFGVLDAGGERKRVRLANEAIRRGAVTVTDLMGEAKG